MGLSGLLAPILLLLIALPLEAEQPLSSTLDYRVTNRRFIQDILVDAKNGPRLTIITTHPGVWAFKSTPHALYYQCVDLQECSGLLRELDEKLQTGQNLGLRLQGARILEIKFFAQ